MRGVFARRSLQRLIGDFVAKIILLVGLVNSFTEILSSAPPPLAFNHSTSEAAPRAKWVGRPRAGPPRGAAGAGKRTSGHCRALRAILVHR
jgi:hypothetical protein